MLLQYVMPLQYAMLCYAIAIAIAVAVAVADAVARRPLAVPPQAALRPSSRQGGAQGGRRGRSVRDHVPRLNILQLPAQHAGEVGWGEALWLGAAARSYRR